VIDVGALEMHRHQASTASGVISCLDVCESRPAPFFHGLATHSLLWRCGITEIASQQRCCIAVELPGHGQQTRCVSTPGASVADLMQHHRAVRPFGFDRSTLYSPP
jgi:pimeloyl-ACP methyl ester carboxylesterase